MGGREYSIGATKLRSGLTLVGFVATVVEDLLAAAAVLAIAGELQNRPGLSFRYPSIRTLATVITVFTKNRQILSRHLVCPTLGTNVGGDASQLPIQPTPLGIISDYAKD